MIKKAVIGTLFFVWCSYAQKPVEIGLISENDLYTSPVNDQYYTNGFEIFYRYLGTTEKEEVAKRINEFKVGQHIYNPQSAAAGEIQYHDRPFAGYLFAGAGISTFYKSENVFKIAFQAGVVGPESQAQQVQEGLHNIFGYHTVKGWEYQITTIPAVQGSAFYSHKILKETLGKNADFNVQGEVHAGTVWTGASIGAMARISLKGMLLPMYDSNLHNAALNHNKDTYKEQRELYLYLSPNLNYQVYDGTIQGSLFNDNSPVTFPIIPFRFNAEAGIKFRRNNLNLYYSFNYRGKELTNNVISGYYYGSVGIGYLL